MSDLRNRPRKNTPHHVKVQDDGSGRVLGRVVDITADGLMLVSEQSIPRGLVTRLRINLPIMVQNRSDITVEAEAVWSTQDTNPRFFNSGWKFLNLSGDEGYLLEEVMHKLNLVG